MSNNSSTILISVIIPAYNVERYIAEAIRSVLNQSYTSFELIISDDASTDRTVELVNSFKDSRIRLIRNSKNVGYSQNMNLLLKQAKGEYIVIQDGDDYCHPDRLRVLLDFLSAHQEYMVVGSSYIKFDDRGKKEVVLMPTDVKIIKEQFDAMHYPLPVVNGCMMLRKKVVEDGVLYRHLKYINRAQDDDLLFRLSEKYAMANVPDVLYYYRTNNSSMTLNPSSFNKYSYFSSDYITFLKRKRENEHIDYLEQEKFSDIEAFFKDKWKICTQNEPAFFELYFASKYLGAGDKKNGLKWLLKALLKSPFRLYIWKKIFYESFRK